MRANEPLPEPSLTLLSEFVSSHTGLHFPRRRWRELERGIRSAAREFGFDSAAQCVRWLLSAPLTRPQVEVLASHLTVGETYFLRDKKIFAALEEEVLPGIIRLRRGGEQRLRVWSAGCSTGEEAYSIAILLDRLLPDIKDWRIMILATDINPRFLRHGVDGIYSQWSFRDTPSWIKKSYFEAKRDGRYEIRPHLKRMIAFSYLNLADDIYPSLANNTNAMDLIVCRNVLMYFAAEQIKNVLSRFYRCLVEGGWLIVSPTDVSHNLFRQFAAATLSGVTLYPVPQNAPHVSAGMNVLDVPEGRCPKATNVSPGCGVYRKARSGEPQPPVFTPPPYAPEPESRSAETWFGLETSLPESDGAIQQPAPSGAIQSDVNNRKVRHFRESGNPGLSPTQIGERNWIPGQARNDKQDRTYAATYRNPDSAPAPSLYAEALALYELGQYSAAVQKLEEPMAQQSGAPEAMALLARAFANQGKLAEAREWSEKAITADKLNPRLYYLLAVILLEQGCLDDAARSFKKALYLDPNFVLAHLALGNIARELRKRKESDKHFDNALALLGRYRHEETLPESEGMTAGRLAEVIRAMKGG